MYTYIVNFRLEDNETYSERYEQLMSYFSPPEGYQSKATSTLMLHLPLDIECFKDDLKKEVRLDKEDYLLIFQVFVNAHIIRVEEYINGDFTENKTLLNALNNFLNPFEEQKQE